MKTRITLFLEIDFREWAIPLEIWWRRDALCFEILCFAMQFMRKNDLQS
jgi:hypothetical protein